MDVRDADGEDAGSSFMEWSNALADVVAQHTGELVPCVFFGPQNPNADLDTVELRVRPMFVPSEATQGPTSVIAEELAQPGELTQSLCSPWQNDYQECGCYYWAASRPDYVNVEHTAAGAIGNKSLARSRELKTYDVPGPHEPIEQSARARLLMGRASRQRCLWRPYARTAAEALFPAGPAASAISIQATWRALSQRLRVIEGSSPTTKEDTHGLERQEEDHDGKAHP